ncbi:tetratricopeptide repeat protein [Kitasatospora sp. NPDC057198]|uniref:tetratricopeptide repeat protein n=1 Tax=Kitasatospora sp. NPDC057198 TaxID=3346046 RepID=UPI00362B0198
MSGRGPSRQELIRRRRRSGFVGRSSELASFNEVLRQPPEDAAQFLFHVRGPSGVGKSTLVRQLENAAREAGAVTGYVDESVTDVVEAMQAVVGQLAQQGAPLKALGRQLSTYRQRRHEADAGLAVGEDRAGVAGPSAASVVASRIGLVGAAMVPGVGAFTAALDANQVAAGAEQLKGMLSARFRSHDDAQLVLSPVRTLTPVFLQDLAEVAQKHSWVVLFFDTYERTGPLLDGWIRDVLVSDRYGELPANVLVVLAGQGRLDAQCWGDWLDLVTDLPLEVFTESEARQLLAAKGVTDEHVIEVILQLSGRLPLLVSTLAEAQPSDAADVGDPSGTAVERFLKWETQPARRAAALACALPQDLDEDVYRAAVDDEEVRELFGWLRSLSFVIDRSGRCHYHDVVRTPMLRLQRRQWPTRWQQQHTRLAETFARWRIQRADDGAAPTRNWRDDRWREYRLQETYHRLCADPRQALGPALRELLDAYGQGTAVLRRWVRTLLRAGQDTDAEDVRGWGERLTVALNEPEPGIAAVTLLLSGGRLDRKGRAFGHLLRGEAHSSAERHGPALADLDRAIELDPEYVRAFGSRGRALAALGRYEEALADFERALDLDPRYTWVLGSRSNAYADMGRYEEALADLDRAIELDPEYVWAFGSRGRLLKILGHYEEALADLERAVESDLEYGWAICHRGYVLMVMGRCEEALADFERAIDLDFDDMGWLYCRRGTVLAGMGRYEEALADFERAIELGPDEAGHHYDKALALHALGLPGWEACLARAVELARRREDGPSAFQRIAALCFLVCAYAAMLNQEESERALEKFLGAAPPPGALVDLRLTLVELAQVVPESTRVVAALQEHLLDLPGGGASAEGVG